MLKKHHTTPQKPQTETTHRNHILNFTFRVGPCKGPADIETIKIQAWRTKLFSKEGWLSHRSKTVQIFSTFYHERFNVGGTCLGPTQILKKCSYEKFKKSRTRTTRLTRTTHAHTSTTHTQTTFDFKLKLKFELQFGVVCLFVFSKKCFLLQWFVKVELGPENVGQTLKL